MSSNQESLFAFEADLRKFAEVMRISHGTVVKKVVFDLHRKIVMRTPVLTGMLRASWGIEKGAAGSDTADVGVRTGEQAAEVARSHQRKVHAVSDKAASETIFWIYNNLPYAVPIEYGHSQRAPAGMVRVSIAEVEAEIQSYLGKAK